MSHLRDLLLVKDERKFYPGNVREVATFREEETKKVIFIDSPLA